jgi:hypothetical protein
MKVKFREYSKKENADSTFDPCAKCAKKSTDQIDCYKKNNCTGGYYVRKHKSSDRRLLEAMLKCDIIFRSLGATIPPDLSDTNFNKLIKIRNSITKAGAK